MELRPGRGFEAFSEDDASLPAARVKGSTESGVLSGFVPNTPAEFRESDFLERVGSF
jgi:hypothetical protein